MNLFQRYLADEFAEDYSEGRMCTARSPESDRVGDRESTYGKFDPVCLHTTD